MDVKLSKIGQDILYTLTRVRKPKQNAIGTPRPAGSFCRGILLG